MDTERKTLLVLGGYGNFGRRIVAHFIQRHDCHVIVAGRHLALARNWVEQLQNQSPNASIEAQRLDCSTADFAAQLITIAPFLTIHTGGPFQGQSYRVAEACLSAGSHYLDLADDTNFVVNFDQLHQQALANHLLLISGASSVPGLSSCIIEHYRSDFSQIHSIDIAIAPGNQAERGRATLQGILSYTGHPFQAMRDGHWQSIYGWMDSRQIDFGPPLGLRWLANVDVPDLQLFPSHFSVRDSVSFQAGLELPLLHHIMNLMAWLSKKRWIKNWAPLTRPIFRISQWLRRFGTADGGMRIVVQGFNHQQQSHSITWTLIALDGVGPYIPTLSAIIIGDKLLDGEMIKRGAFACLGFFTHDDFQSYAKPFHLIETTESNGG